MLAGENSDPFGFQFLADLLWHFLMVGFSEASHMADRNELEIRIKDLSGF
jgi:hypothetical protein